MKMDLKLDVFTLNCWGITGVSRHRKERMEAIANHIAASNYDFVFLQEVWNQDDYQLICKKTADVLPYSYYFHSGVLGSGVCILSKGCMVDVTQCQYSLNGYAHKILHGDWYGGKVVGLCKVIHHGLKINLYVTHLHAEYDNLHDEYLPHRVSQAFEFSQFIQLTSETADLSIVAGDFNTEPTDLAYRVIIHNSGCLDSYITQNNGFHKDVSMIRTTCGHPDNMYTSRFEIQNFPKGKRIDYVLYKWGSGTHVECLSCDTPLSKIPGTTIPYSDHEAVVAKLHVYKSQDAPACKGNPNARLEAVDSSRSILQNNIKDIEKNRLFYILLSCVIVAMLLLTTLFDGVGCFTVLVLMFQFIATITLAFCLWMAFIVSKIELSALSSSCNAMGILTNAIMNEYNLKRFPDFQPGVSQSEIIL